MSMAITAACHDPRIWTVLNAIPHWFTAKNEKHRSQSLAQYLPYPSVFRLMQKRASRIKRGKKLVQLIHSKHSRKLVLCPNEVPRPWTMSSTKNATATKVVQTAMPTLEDLGTAGAHLWLKAVLSLEGGCTKANVHMTWKHDGALIWLGQIVQSSARPWEDLSRFQDRSKMPRELRGGGSGEKSLCWSQSCPLLKQE